MSEANDSFDYLSLLVNGFSNHNEDNEKSFVQIDIDYSSDSDSDSEDCFIVDAVQNSSSENVNKTVESHLNPIDVKEEVKVEIVIKQEQKFSKHVKNEVMDQEFKVFDDNASFNIETQSKLNLLNDSKETIDKSIGSFDGEPPVEHSIPTIKDNCEDLVNNNKPVDCNKVESNEIAIQTEDIESRYLVERKSSSSSQSSCSSTLSNPSICDSDREILTAIAKILLNHQRPTLDRMFNMCSRSKNIFPQFAAKDSFFSALNQTMKRGLIKRISTSDGSECYREINSGVQFVTAIRKRKFSGSHSNSVVDASDLSISSNSSSLRNNKLIGRKKSRISVENNLNDCYDLENIDISSETSEMEVDATKLRNLDEDSSFSGDKSISKSLKSIGNWSQNQTSKEVGRKRRISCDKSEGFVRIDNEDWLMEKLPRYSPYIAQKGDRVVYLRDAHEIYIQNELQHLKDNYNIFRCTSHHISNALKTDDYIIFAIVKGVKFHHIRGIKFSVITLKNFSNATDFEFNVLYRPNRGICEFLVLEQFYKNSLNMNWDLHCEFRSLWKKSWWLGVIENKSVFQNKYPKSHFKCFEIKWNTNENGRLSPWDLFVVDMKRLPKKKINGIVATREDLMEFNYRSSLGEWPIVEEVDYPLWRYHECKRIYSGIKTVEKKVSKSVVSVFKNITDKNIAYPITLQVIKDRLKNMYYRRVDSVKTDVNYLKSNIRSYLKKSEFKSAEDFVDLILSIVNDPKCDNEDKYLKCINEYKYLTEPNIASITDYTSTNDDSYSLKPNNAITKPPLPSFSSHARTISTNKSSTKPTSCSLVTQKMKKKKVSPKLSSSLEESLTSAQTSCKVTESKRWKEESQKFIKELFRREDTIPFQQPVDVNQYPNYYTIITDPIDLSTIEDNLKNDLYLNPKQLRDDFRLMFKNAKTYTKNPKATIRQSVKILSNLCEDKLREIIVDWERVYAYEENVKNGKNCREPISRNQLWGYGAQQYY